MLSLWCLLILLTFCNYCLRLLGACAVYFVFRSFIATIVPLWFAPITKSASISTIPDLDAISFGLVYSSYFPLAFCHVTLCTFFYEHHNYVLFLLILGLSIGL